MRVGTLLGVHRKGKREVDQPNWFRLVDGNELLWTLAESGGQGPLLPSAPAVETASVSWTELSEAMGVSAGVVGQGLGRDGGMRGGKRHYRGLAEWLSSK